MTTAFNRLKQTPGPARPETIRLWTDRLAWLTGLLDPDRILEGIAHTKLRQFAAEATALEVSELLGMTRAGKSAFICDLLSQTDPYYDFTLIVEEGLSYGIWTQAQGGTHRNPVDPLEVGRIMSRNRSHAKGG